MTVTANDEQEQRIATLTLSSTDGPMVQTMQITQQRLTPDSTTHYRLPVVFHVLYNKESNKKQNVIEGHLAELIGEVNKLYAQCGVDLRMEFVMATHDPEGNLLEEPGVDRHKINEATLNSSFFMGYGRDPKKYCTYMWDPNRYINIFIYTFEDKGILGISHFPYATKPHAMEGLTELETDAPWEELPWPQCVSINNELQFGRVTAMVDWGVYLYNPARNFYNHDHPIYGRGKRPLFYKMHSAGSDEAWHYIRFGVKCRVWDNIYVQALAKTHMHIAEQIEFGVGYNIPFVSKSKRRDSKDVVFHNREGWWNNY